MQNIEYLDLSENYMKKLINLNLRNNGIEVIPPNINRMENIKIINLFKNKISVIPNGSNGNSLKS